MSLTYVDIRHVQPVRCIRREITVHKIESASCSFQPSRGDRVFTPTHTLDTKVAHHASYLVCTHYPPLVN